ncbi:SOS response-associated peptidase family protein [Sphingomonas sp. MMSM20]|uniref:SOS response-associated peptidase n=1 Tax=Sphingomonas lycopersici TaxID=2951807 RepID=UPI002236FFA1|nr:SOS response-associated peptidase family protein [Sphingomonas lycopersici]
MCNLYAVRRSAAEVAAHFGVENPVASNAGDEVYPGYPGVVVREQDGQRVMQSMAWGFPLRLRTMKPTAKPKAVNNIADLSKNMWIGLARKPQWRCLIPVTAFAEAEGAKGSMTRTWFNLRDQPIFAWGGLWRDSSEWGPVYSGAMTEANGTIAPVHNRMPVLLRPDDYDLWLHGDFDDLIAFQARRFPDELIELTRTADPWSRPRVATAAPSPPESPTLF